MAHADVIHAQPHDASGRPLFIRTPNASPSLRYISLCLADFIFPIDGSWPDALRAGYANRHMLVTAVYRCDADFRRKMLAPE